jgi:hypothetical protein
MSPATVRHIVDSVDDALHFYCTQLGFDEQVHPAPGFAIVGIGDLRLAFSAQLEVSDPDRLVRRLRAEVRHSETTLSSGPADGKYSSTIHPVTQSNCSSRTERCRRLKHDNLSGFTQFQQKRREDLLIRMAKE